MKQPSSSFLQDASPAPSLLLSCTPVIPGLRAARLWVKHLPALFLYPSSLNYHHAFDANLGFPGGSDGKESPAMWETLVWSLGWEDLLEKGTAIDCSILAWRIPWTEEPGRIQSMGSQRVRHNWATLTSLHFIEQNIKSAARNQP